MFKSLLQNLCQKLVLIGLVILKLCCFEIFLTGKCKILRIIKLKKLKIQKYFLIFFVFSPNLWYLFVCSGIRPEKRLRIWSYRLYGVPIGFRTAALYAMQWFCHVLAMTWVVFFLMNTSMPTLAWHPRGCVGIFWIAICYAC